MYAGVTPSVRPFAPHARCTLLLRLQSAKGTLSLNILCCPVDRPSPTQCSFSALQITAKVGALGQAEPFNQWIMIRRIVATILQLFYFVVQTCKICGSDLHNNYAVVLSSAACTIAVTPWHLLVGKLIGIRELLFPYLQVSSMLPYRSMPTNELCQLICAR